jgi:hypothetical protein
LLRTRKQWSWFDDFTLAADDLMRAAQPTIAIEQQTRRIRDDAARATRTDRSFN